MRTFCIVFALVFVVGMSPALAERVSVRVVKTAVAVTTTAVKAVPKAPRAAWRGISWLIKHV